MKILIYGAGVVGCTYGWQLSKAGCDVAVLVRKEQKELVQKDGIRIICSDFRAVSYTHLTLPTNSLV